MNRLFQRAAQKHRLALFALTVVMLGVLAGASANAQEEADLDPTFSATFPTEHCRWSPIGQNAFFSLAPGTKHVLEGEEDGDVIRTAIEVLHKTERVGDVHTRVIEERHYVNGDLDEVSRNYYALCRESNSVFYFGEEVDFYEDGEIIGHEGAWLDGVDGAKFGLYMPSLPLLGARYYQEIAPGAALDRAEITDLAASVSVPYGEFEGCLETVESTPLEPGSLSIKLYCPGIGIIDDDGLELIEYRPGSLGAWPGFRR